MTWLYLIFSVRIRSRTHSMPLPGLQTWSMCRDIFSHVLTCWWEQFSSVAMMIAVLSVLARGAGITRPGDLAGDAEYREDGGIGGERFGPLPNDLGLVELRP